MHLNDLDPVELLAISRYSRCPTTDELLKTADASQIRSSLVQQDRAVRGIRLKGHPQIGRVG